MDYGTAIEQIRQGRRVTRTRWAMHTFVFLVPESIITVEEGRPLAYGLDVGSRVRYLAHIDICYVNEKREMVVTVWNPYPEDMLADDWELVTVTQ